MDDMKVLLKRAMVIIIVYFLYTAVVAMIYFKSVNGDYFMELVHKINSNLTMNDLLGAWMVMTAMALSFIIVILLWLADSIRIMLKAPVFKEKYKK